MYSSFRFAGSANWLKNTLSVACLGASLLMTQAASATTVQFQTVLGDFEVNLFDKTTPKTVANFLTYVNAGAYDNTIVHRSVKDFVIQGGGYEFTGEVPLVTVPQHAAVENEPVYSNLRGTIAMAKLGGNPNSATSQWFINLNNKNATDREHGYVLDTNNGGFSVFGQVMGEGMEVVDAIAALNRFTIGALAGFPLRNYSYEDNTNNVPITGEHLVLIEKVVVLNADPDTAASLNPAKNTLINEKEDKKDGGSGSLGLLSLLALGLVALGRKSLLNKA